VGPDLAERARVVAPDLAGFGYTPLDGRSASVESNRAFLDRFIETIAPEPVALIGNSMGGLISILEAAASPERVAAMVLIDPAVPPVPGEPLDPVTEQLFSVYDTPGMGESFLRQMVEALGLEETFDQMMAYICADATRLEPGLRERQLAMARERLAQPWSDQAFLEAARSLLVLLWHDPARFFDALDRATPPTLLLEGELDRLVLVGAAREIARRRPDWTLQVIPGIGHVPMMEDPSGVVEAVTGWLEGQGFLEGPLSAFG
jgi:pimeloyl-ACP methyl ester carboxylesterase